MTINSEQSGTAASGQKKTRLEDRFATAARAFEGLNEDEVVELLNRLYETKVKPVFPAIKDIRDEVGAFFKGFVKGVRDEWNRPSLSYVSQLHQLCDQRKYSKPTFIERSADGEHLVIVGIILPCVKGRFHVHFPHAEATALTKREARERACKLLIEKITQIEAKHGE